MYEKETGNPALRPRLTSPLVGRSRGFGFVTMKDPSLVQVIIRESPHYLDGKQVTRLNLTLKIDCKKAVPKDQAAGARLQCNPTLLPAGAPPQTYAHVSSYGGGGAYHPPAERKQSAMNSGHTSPSKQARESGEPKSKKIFVGGLPHDLDEHEFKKYFEKFGKIDDCVVMFDRNTGKPRGFGFITFSSEESVNAVITSKQEHQLRGKWVDCKRATPKMGYSTSSSTASSQQTTVLAHSPSHQPETPLMPKDPAQPSKKIKNTAVAAATSVVGELSPPHGSTTMQSVAQHLQSPPPHNAHHSVMNSFGGIGGGADEGGEGRYWMEDEEDLFGYSQH